MQDMEGIGMLLKLALSRADAAAQRLSSAASRCRGERARLDVLLEHQRLYAARLGERSRTGMDPAAMANFRVFLDKLEAAIAWQRQILTECERSAGEQRRGWEAERRTARSFDALLARQGRARLQQEQRRTQREHDEIALAQHARALQSAGAGI